MVRTQASQACRTGSNPVWATYTIKGGIWLQYQESQKEEEGLKEQKLERSANMRLERVKKKPRKRLVKSSG